MTPIETERLMIRNFLPDDWAALQKLAIQYESSEYANYDYPWPTSDDEIKGITEWFATTDKFLAVCLKVPGVVIGYIALIADEGDLAFNLGYRFDFDYHGNGYATESCRAVVDYAFGHLGATKVVSGTAIQNEPSCRLLVRLGMKQISQNITSFRDTAEGQPMEFLGASYELTLEDWTVRQSASSGTQPA